MYAVIDCNNFFVSCELAFNPALKGKPVVVASNNDGVIVSRSKEAKKIGIPMGAVIFKWRDLIDRYQVKIFSGNFALYGDMSRRVMQSLQLLAPKIEIYSIDEAFIDLSGIWRGDLLAYGRDIRSKILQWIGIPVSVGIGSTKTLAKAAVEIAKKNEQFAGVFSAEVPDFDNWLERLPVGDIWGIGWRSSALLNRNGIFTAKQFKHLSETWVLQYMKVTGQRTLLELKGIPCVRRSDLRERRKGIISSRSFGKPVESLTQMEESVTLFTARAVERLRSDHSLASFIQVYITTNYHKQDESQYANSAGYQLVQPSCYTPAFIKSAKIALRTIFKPGFRYKKAMVMLSGITPDTQVQLNMFHQYHPDKRDRRLMRAVDILNQRYGRTTLEYAASGIKRAWKPRSESLSRRFTTSWADIPVVLAK
jgi:DNA polymerase V